MAILEDGFYFVALSVNDYTKFPATLTRLKDYPQNPIKPSEMEFSALLDVPMPEFAEVIFVVKGIHRFHGVVVDRGDGLTVWKCKAKSMQYFLDWRYIPDILYDGSDIATILSSGLPSVTANPVGVLFALQSLVPNGLWEYYSATVSKLAGAGTDSALRNFAVYISTNYPKPGGTTDGYDGTYQLAEAASLGAIGSNKYYRDANDLYVQFLAGLYRNNAFFTFVSGWADCKIRLGNIDVHDYVPAIRLSLEGQASKSLDEFFEKLGREIQFLPSNDGYVYLNAGLPIGRGSETEPIRKFVHNSNCSIRYKAKNEPDVQAAIGIEGENEPTTAVVDWSRMDPQLFKIYDGKGRLQEDIKANLQNIMLQNLDYFYVTIPEPDYFLRVGDYVELVKEDFGSKILRIRIIDINKGVMELECGKKPFSLSKSFGEKWKPEEDPDTQVIEAKTLLATGGTFIAKAADVVKENWKCYYEITFTEADDGSEISQNAFITVSLNGNIIPPGRIKVDGDTIKIDITKYCNTSPTVDTTNTLVLNSYNMTGWTVNTLEVSKQESKNYSNGSYSYQPGAGNWLGCG